MTRLFLFAAMAVPLLSVTSLQAQFSGGPVRPGPGKGGINPGNSNARSGIRSGEPLAVYPGRPAFFVPLGIPIFPFASLGWVDGPSLLAARPAIVIVSPPIVTGNNNFVPNFNPAPAGDDDIPPGMKPGDQLIIKPKRALPLLPPPDAPMPEPIAPAALRPRPKPIDDEPFAPRKIVNLDKPDPDPEKEAARLVKLGKNAFAAGEFGAAGEHFDRASVANPKSALPHFLKAQSSFAAGKYADAVASIRVGLDLERTWPGSPFDPKELYGTAPAVFNEHLATLRGVVAANPAEATLEFLLGYELWFIGEKVEAKKWFDLAEKRLPAPGPIALFK